LSVVVSNRLMKLKGAWSRKGVILLGGLLGIFFATIGYLKYRVDAPHGVEWLPRTPDTSTPARWGSLPVP